MASSPRGCYCWRRKKIITKLKLIKAWKLLRAIKANWVRDSRNGLATRKSLINGSIFCALLFLLIIFSTLFLISSVEGGNLPCPKTTPKQLLARDDKSFMCMWRRVACYAFYLPSFQPVIRLIEEFVGFIIFKMVSTMIPRRAYIVLDEGLSWELIENLWKNLYQRQTSWFRQIKPSISN